MVHECKSIACIVATGSGMFSLLSAFCHARPNNFVLWDAVERNHVSVGRVPSPRTARSMAQRIVAAYAPGWPATVRAGVTAQAIVDELAPGKHGNFTSPRPALVAYVVSNMPFDAADAATALAAAVQSALRKLDDESLLDTAAGLTTLSRSEVRSLRAVAVTTTLPAVLAAAASHSSASPAASGRTAFEATFVPRLCDDRGSLLPPYGALVSSWTLPDGSLAVAVNGRDIVLAADVDQILTFLDQHRHATHAKSVAPASRTAISTAVLTSLAGNGVGVPLAAPAHVYRPPTTHAEALAAVPTLAAVLDELNNEQRACDGRDSPAYTHAKGPAANAAHLGWDVVVWLRHLEAHVFFGASSRGRTTALTASVAAAAVREAAKALVAGQPAATFAIDAATGYLIEKQDSMTMYYRDEPRAGIASHRATPCDTDVGEVLLPTACDNQAT